MIDVGADFIEIDPGGLIGGTYTFSIALSSLDWVDDPTAVISNATLSGTGPGLGGIGLTYTTDSVALAAANFFVAGDTLIRVDLQKEAAVPLPGAISLLLCGLGVLGIHRRKNDGRRETVIGFK